METAPTKKWHGHLAIVATNIFFGINISISKSLLSGWISPLWLTFVRVLFGTIAFWSLSLFLGSEKVHKKDIFLLLYCALLGIVLNQNFFTMGLERTSPLDAGLIATLNPLIVMLISAAVLKEPITLKKAGGVIIGAFGALLIVLRSASHITGQSSSLSGNILCLMSSIAYSTYLVISKPISQRYSSATIMKWMFLFSAILMAPFVLAGSEPPKLFMEHPPTTSIIQLTFVLIGPTLLAYLFIPIALKRIRPTTVSMYNYLQPIVAGIVSIIAGQNRLTWDKPIATVLIFTGVWLVTRSKSRADIEKHTTTSL